MYMYNTTKFSGMHLVEAMISAQHIQILCPDLSPSFAHFTRLVESVHASVHAYDESSYFL